MMRFQQANDKAKAGKKRRHYRVRKVRKAKWGEEISLWEKFI